MTEREIRDPYVLGHPAVASLPRRLLHPAALGRLVHALAGDPLAWRPHTHHDPTQRWHARLVWTPTLEVYLLGWDTAQDTRIHDHGGSSGAFAVAAGQLVEQHGTISGTRLDERLHRTGAVASFGPDYVHNLGHGGGVPATSVHAYSPPLSVMRFYTPAADGRLVASYQLPVAGPEPDDGAPQTTLAAPTSGALR